MNESEIVSILPMPGLLCHVVVGGLLLVKVLANVP